MDNKNLKEAIVLGAKGFQAYSDAMKDGKVDASDILFLIPVAQAIQPALQDINQIPAEALDLDAKEMDDLIVAVMENAPALKTKAEALLRIRAIASLLVAAKDCYNAFTKAPVVPGVAVAANSFEGKVPENGSLRAALRADAQGSEENKAAAEAKKEAILAAREKEAAKAVVAANSAPVEEASKAAPASEVAAVVADAQVSGEPKASV